MIDQSHLTQMHVGFDFEDPAHSLYPEEEEEAEKGEEEMEILEQVDEVSERIIKDTESLPDVSACTCMHVLYIVSIQYNYM